MNVALLVLAAVLAQDPPKTGGPFAVEIAKPQTEYWCSVPDSYDAGRAWPLMVILHGAGDTARNFIQFWHGGGMKAGFILAAAKSRGQAWDDSDGDIILAVLDDVKKRYTVDPDRTLLTGYSSGGFMATRWGFKNPLPWRVITAIAGASEGGGKDYKASIGRMSVLIECGERDPNLGICKQVFEKVKKDGFDCESNWVPKMEHSPLLPVAAEWVYERILARIDAPTERLKRARKAASTKRFADAIAEYKAVIDQQQDEKLSKAAASDLAKIEKSANDKWAEAQKKIEKGDKAGAKKLLEEVAAYRGLECAEKAAEALKDLRR